MNEELLLRVYFDPAEIGEDGYPFVWHFPRSQGGIDEFMPAVKDYIREQAGNRCERCGHPYEKGMGEWSPCDDRCTHVGPVRDRPVQGQWPTIVTEAQWRILTVHHLNGVKHDLRWWNLAALCQRCHLTIQAKVRMHREWNREHTEWFKPHAAGFYAAEILGLTLTHEEVIAEMDEILETQLLQHPLEGFV